jgi:hypothetical protein
MLRVEEDQLIYVPMMILGQTYHYDHDNRKITQIARAGYTVEVCFLLAISASGLTGAMHPAILHRAAPIYSAMRKCEVRSALARQRTSDSMDRRAAHLSLPSLQLRDRQGLIPTSRRTGNRAGSQALSQDDNIQAANVSRSIDRYLNSDALFISNIRPSTSRHSLDTVFGTPAIRA